MRACAHARVCMRVYVYVNGVDINCPLTKGTIFIHGKSVTVMERSSKLFSCTHCITV